MKIAIISDLPKTLAFMPGMKASKSETNRKGSTYSQTMTGGFSESDVNMKITPRFSAEMFIGAGNVGGTPSVLQIVPYSHSRNF